MNKEMPNEGEVAIKLFEGRLLDLEEFKVAVRTGMFGVESTPETDAQFVSAHKALVGTYYDSSKGHGYICGQHPDHALPDGGYCGWGIHLNELEANYLTPANWSYLNRKFLRLELRKVFSADEVKKLDKDYQAAILAGAKIVT